MADQHTVQEHGQVTFTAYIVGFTGSLLCTIIAFTAVELHLRSHSSATGWLMALVAILALTQFVIQARLFLHVGAETKPRVKLLSFYFMLLVVLIVLFGSIWIMQNLNYHMQMPTDIWSYMQNKDSL